MAVEVVLGVSWSALVIALPIIPTICELGSETSELFNMASLAVNTL